MMLLQTSVTLLHVRQFPLYRFTVVLNVYLRRQNKTLALLSSTDDPSLLLSSSRPLGHVVVTEMTECHTLFLLKLDAWNMSVLPQAHLSDQPSSIRFVFKIYFSLIFRARQNRIVNSYASTTVAIVGIVRPSVWLSARHSLELYRNHHVIHWWIVQNNFYSR